MSIDDVYPADANLDLPKRPPWSYSMSCAEVERREERYFKVSDNVLFILFLCWMSQMCCHGILLSLSINVSNRMFAHCLFEGSDSHTVSRYFF